MGKAEDMANRLDPEGNDPPPPAAVGRPSRRKIIRHRPVRRVDSALPPEQDEQGLDEGGVLDGAPQAPQAPIIDDRRADMATELVPFSSQGRDPAAMGGAPSHPPAPAQAPALDAGGVDVRRIPPGAVIEVYITERTGKGWLARQTWYGRDVTAAGSVAEFVRRLPDNYPSGHYTVRQRVPKGEPKVLDVVPMLGEDRPSGAVPASADRGSESMSVLRDGFQILTEAERRAEENLRRQQEQQEREAGRYEGLMQQMFQYVLSNKDASGGGMAAILPITLMMQSLQRPQVQQAVAAPQADGYMRMLDWFEKQAKEREERAERERERERAAAATVPFGPAAVPVDWGAQSAPESPADLFRGMGDFLAKLMPLQQQPQAPAWTPDAVMNMVTTLADRQKGPDFTDILAKGAPVVTAVVGLVGSGVAAAKLYLEERTRREDDARKAAEERAERAEERRLELERERIRAMETELRDMKRGGGFSGLKEAVGELKSLQEFLGGGETGMKDIALALAPILRGGGSSARPAAPAAPPLVQIAPGGYRADGQWVPPRFGMYVTHPGGQLPDGSVMPPQQTLVEVNVATAPPPPALPAPAATAPGPRNPAAAAPGNGAGAAQPAPAPAAPPAPAGGPATGALDTLPLPDGVLDSLRQAAMRPQADDNGRLTQFASAIGALFNDARWQPYFGDLLQALRVRDRVRALKEVSLLLRHFARKGWLPEDTSGLILRALEAKYDELVMVVKMVTGDETIPDPELPAQPANGVVQ